VLKQDTIASLVAGLTAMAVLMAVMILPLLGSYVVAGLPLDGKGPEWGVWGLMAGGILGALLAFRVHNLILVRVFGFSEQDARRTFFENHFERRSARVARYESVAFRVSPPPVRTGDPFWDRDTYGEPADEESLAGTARPEGPGVAPRGASDVSPSRATACRACGGADVRLVSDVYGVSAESLRPTLLGMYGPIVRPTRPEYVILPRTVTPPQSGGVLAPTLFIVGAMVIVAAGFLQPVGPLWPVVDLGLVLLVVGLGLLAFSLNFDARRYAEQVDDWRSARVCMSCGQITLDEHAGGRL